MKTKKNINVEFEATATIDENSHEILKKTISEYLDIIPGELYEITAIEDFKTTADGNVESTMYVKRPGSESTIKIEGVNSKRNFLEVVVAGKFRAPGED